MVGKIVNSEVQGGDMDTSMASKELVSIVTQLSKANSLQQIMDIVRIGARKLVGSDGAAFVLKDGDSCYYAEENAIAPLWKGNRFPLKACISGWSMLNKEVVVIPDIYKDPRIPVEAYRPTFVKSLVMVPIRKDDPLGAIGNYWAVQRTASAEEVEILQALADTVAVAFENVKLYDEMKAQIASLESINKLKIEFLMNLSHEMRTPLSAVIGWSQILSENNRDYDPEIMMGLAAIQRNAYHQLSIVDDLLDLAGTLSGRLSFQKTIVDVETILRGTIDEYRDKAAKKRVSIELETFEHPDKIFADQTRISQIFRKLLDNAIRFCEEGGHIKAVVDKDQGFARISIHDDGHGIEPEKISTLFNPFQQADASTTKKFGGLGLGLSIAQRLAEAHGGHLIAKSEGLGHGADFAVYLPMQVDGV